MLAISPIDSTYEEVVRLVHKMVHQFKHPLLPSEEAKSAAGEAYARAYLEYDLSKGTKFSWWVAYKVRRALQTEIRKRISRARHPLGLMDMDLLPDQPHEFDLDALMDGLSEDAKQTVEMVFHPPKEVKKLVKEFGGRTPVNLRVAIRLFLLDIGWSKSHVSRVFTEIRSALK